jgi:hypothetical protein
VGADNSINYTYSFDAYYNNLLLTNAALTETLGLPTSANPAGAPIPTGQNPSGSTGGSGGRSCTTVILSAINNHFGTNFGPGNVGTEQFEPFAWPQVPGGTVNIDVFVPPQMRPDGISPGRYPVNWWTYLIGSGPTLHMPAGPRGLDSFQTLAFSGSQFTAHVDSAFPYNPIGAAFHLFHDVLGIGGHSPCP